MYELKCNVVVLLTPVLFPPYCGGIDWPRPKITKRRPDKNATGDVLLNFILGC